MRLFRTSLIKMLLIGTVAVCIVYLATMGRVDAQEGSRILTSPEWLRGLFVGERFGENRVSASAFFTSSYTYDYNNTGCGCYGIFKPQVLAGMLMTWQFYANVFIFSTFSYILLAIGSKKFRSTPTD